MSNPRVVFFSSPCSTSSRGSNRSCCMAKAADPSKWSCWKVMGVHSRPVPSARVKLPLMCAPGLSSPSLSLVTV